MADQRLAPTLSVPQERAVLAAARGGDREAVAHLVRYLTPHIQKRAAFEVLRHRRGAPAVRRDVEDLVHDVWARLFDADWRILRAWDPARGACLRSYVAMITTRLAIDLHRSGRSNPYLERSAAGEELDRREHHGPDLERRIEARSLLTQLVHRVKARLTPAAEQVFDATFVEGEAIEEAVHSTGLTRASIYSHRKRISKVALEVAGELMHS